MFYRPTLASTRMDGPSRSTSRRLRPRTSRSEHQFQWAREEGDALGADARPSRGDLPHAACLAHLDELGAPVLNGANAFRYEVSKAAKYSLMAATREPAPRDAGWIKPQTAAGVWLGDLPDPPPHGLRSSSSAACHSLASDPPRAIPDSQ